MTEAKSFGRQKSCIKLYRGAEYVIDFQSKVRSEIVLGNENIAVDTRRSARPLRPVS